MSGGLVTRQFNVQSNSYLLEMKGPRQKLNFLLSIVLPETCRV